MDPTILAVKALSCAESDDALTHDEAPIAGSNCDWIDEASVALRGMLVEITAWRARFPHHVYRPQDDCVALRK